MENEQSLSLHKVVVVGHVDHGKSTLLGRILLECGRVPDDRIKHVEKICADKNLQFEPAFLFDALQEEQEQGISIDTTRVNFEYGSQKFILIDAPGHLEFLKNMTSGASEAELGILVVDGNQGVRSQTERHLKIFNVLGIKSVLVALNKIDQINYDQSKFEQVCVSTRELIEQQGISCQGIVPISALKGENITMASKNLDWYVGKPLLATLQEVTQHLDASKGVDSSPFRMLLQDVYRFDGERYFAGRIISGKITPGSEIFFSPSGKISKIEAIEIYPQGSVESAVAGDSVALRLSEQIFVERGEVISLPDYAPEVDTEFRGKIAWLSRLAYSPENEYLIKVGTKEVTGKIELVKDPDAKPLNESNITNGTFIDGVVKLTHAIAFDKSSTGSIVDKFVICSEYETVGVGVVDSRPVHASKALRVNPNLRHESGYVERHRYEERGGARARDGHRRAARAVGALATTCDVPALVGRRCAGGHLPDRRLPRVRVGVLHRDPAARDRRDGALRIPRAGAARRARGGRTARAAAAHARGRGKRTARAVPRALLRRAGAHLHLVLLVSPSTSVVIPVRNGGRRFAELLEALDRQVLDGGFELLVADSSSRDGSAELARAHGAEVITIEPGAFGHGRTRNRLLERASGEHVALLTQDAVPAHKRWLAELLAGFALAPNVGLVFGPYLPVPGASPMVSRELGAWFGSLAAPDGGPSLTRLYGAERDLDARELLGARGYFTDANGCVLRAAWEQVRFRDVDYAEDHWLAHDMLRAGYVKAFVPAAAVIHSHDYSLGQWLRRSFDETRAVQLIYGTVPGGDPRSALRNLRGSVGADWRASGRRPRALGTSLAHHGARTAGVLLGAHAGRLPAAVRTRFSLERRG